MIKVFETVAKGESMSNNENDIIRRLIRIIDAQGESNPNKRVAAILALSYRSLAPRESAKIFIRIINTKIGRSDEEKIASIIALGKLGQVFAEDTLREVIGGLTEYSEQVKNVAIDTLDFLKITEFEEIKS